MPRISIQQIALDSVLAAPLLDSQGRILLSAGVRLTPSLIKRLERWCIAHVTVASSSENESPIEGVMNDGADDPSRHWDDQFARHRDDPQMQTIHRALIEWNTTRNCPEA